MSEPAKLSIDDVVKASLSVGRYLRAQKRFEEAEAELQLATTEIQTITTHTGAFVTQKDFQYYLVQPQTFGTAPSVTPIQMV